MPGQLGSGRGLRGGVGVADVLEARVWVLAEYRRQRGMGRSPLVAAARVEDAAFEGRLLAVRRGQSQEPWVARSTAARAVSNRVLERIGVNARWRRP